MNRPLFARSHAGLTLLALLATSATAQVDGQCLPPPRALVGLDTLDYISEPDINGVRLLVGHPSTRSSAVC
ncbi:MAG: hypothetical protein Q8N47_03290 [Bryobacterales bacterium]|nr:hypothetical protein [Bryobacterales bacterium]